MKTLQLFFAEDGYLRLSVENPRYHQLLKLFRACEKFIKVMSKNLDALNEKQDCLYSADVISNEDMVRPTLRIFFSQLKGLEDFQEMVRKRSRLDEKLI